MQDRTSANSMKVLLQRTAGPYKWVMSGPPSNLRFESASPKKADKVQRG
jgi:hypothetical protein